MTAEHEKPWRPLAPDEVKVLLEGAPFHWWIAGGCAIENFVGRSFRSHGDIDVLILRKDRALARAWLADWDCWVADPPGSLRPWRAGEALPLSVSDIWCRRRCGDPWRFQLMLDDSDEVYWRSRRDPRVSKPISELGWNDADGIPFLVPEVQLFYKAKAPRPKDAADFVATLPLLSHRQKNLLKNAIVAAYGQKNSWLRLLDD
jgi:hypothetical protein